MKVFHFHNGTGGGVWSVIKNLLRFSESGIENHIIHAVNRAIVPQYSIEQVEGAASQQLYYYSANNNFYHTCRELAKLIPDNKAVIVAHDWVELGMVSNLGLQNRVVQVLHGDYSYYYELAKLNSRAIDVFICISPKISHSLKTRLPERQGDIFYINFPVPCVVPKKVGDDCLRLVYYVRDLNDNRKQFSTIIEIARQLSNTNGDYFFTIAGSGITPDEFFAVWPEAMKSRVSFKGVQTNEAMIAILKEQDVFLLPSLAEGLPVSLVEAMKAGIVPLVTNWDSAADELVKPGVTGYYFKPGAAYDYVATIKDLHANRTLLNHLSDNCIHVANKLFHPEENTRRFEVAIEFAHRKENERRKPKQKVYGSRLDNGFIPNIITYTIRNWRKK